MILPAGSLLDTNVISEMMRPSPNRRVAGFVDAIAREGIAISVVSAWEILNGIGRLPGGQRRENLAFRFRSLLEEVFEGRVFDWTLADAEACARLMEVKRRRGESLDHHVPDAMIAATALRHGLTLVTRNEGDFRNTGIQTVDPWEAPPIIQLRAAPLNGGKAVG